VLSAIQERGRQQDAEEARQQAGAAELEQLGQALQEQRAEAEGKLQLAEDMLREAAEQAEKLRGKLEEVREREEEAREDEGQLMLLQRQLTAAVSEVRGGGWRGAECLGDSGCPYQALQPCFDCPTVSMGVQVMDASRAPAHRLAEEADGGTGLWGRACL
jgi:hypothetical protein